MGTGVQSCELMDCLAPARDVELLAVRRGLLQMRIAALLNLCQPHVSHCVTHR